MAMASRMNDETMTGAALTFCVSLAAFPLLFRQCHGGNMSRQITMRRQAIMASNILKA